MGSDVSTFSLEMAIADGPSDGRLEQPASQSASTALQPIRKFATNFIAPSPRHPPLILDRPLQADEAGRQQSNATTETFRDRMTDSTRFASRIVPTVGLRTTILPYCM
ncbi:hypothetical protein [Prosthecomicrobium hirschii]|uniref:hypothetical protein n=1 Tax=Prosthecodimorpha hirschii TaxID=665126 RepID=UPI00222033DB|nr:hypothetical protein [Prosthecomicrobium hirschii]MCW1839990.1 hypothetical protein [Prosthecomicrobium hirschii]